MTTRHAYGIRAGVVALAVPTAVLAMTPPREIEVVCPLDGSKFKARLGGSGYSEGVNLDLQPYGNIASPVPLAKCPGNGFVVYKTTFSEDELTRFRQFVDTPEYKELQSSETNHFLAAKLMSFIGADSRETAHAYLRATWGNRPPAQYGRYAREALNAFTEALKRPYPDRRLWFTDQLVAGELERRLGKFEDALKRFSMLLSLQPEIDNPENKPFRRIAEFQVELVKRSNPSTYPAPKDKP